MHEPPAANGRFEPRTLDANERAVLELLLGQEFLGVKALRRQVPHVRVVGRCPRGCATVYFEVERSSCEPAPDRSSPILSEALVRDEADEPRGGVIVFLKDGYLSTLEVYTYFEPIRIWPPLDRLRGTLRDA